MLPLCTDLTFSCLQRLFPFPSCVVLWHTVNWLYLKWFESGLHFFCGWRKGAACPKLRRHCQSPHQPGQQPTQNHSSALRLGGEQRLHGTHAAHLSHLAHRHLFLLHHWILLLESKSPSTCVFQMSVDWASGDVSTEMEFMLSVWDALRLHASGTEGRSRLG